MDRAARLINRALELSISSIRPGSTCRSIADRIDQSLIRGGADPGSIIRISPESVVWHGMPGDRGLRYGEILSVDVACSVHGWWADMARTFPVGDIDESRRRLIRGAWEGTRIAARNTEWEPAGGDLASRLAAVAEFHGIALIPEAAGHGIGRRLHEPAVLTYDRNDPSALDVDRGYTAEPVFTTGAPLLSIANDGSTVTADGAPSAHFEVTFVLLGHGSVVLGDPEWLERPPC